jgi:very-short-patch-repair endonuclease
MQNRTLIRNRARALRRSMSEPEVMLWSRLRGRGGAKPIFRRQQPIGSIIVDFFCPVARLAIEVDGSNHWDEERRRRDEARDRWLAGQGISVMRIPASAVYGDLSAVVDGILARVAEFPADAPRRRLSPATPRSSAGFSPASAGGPPPPMLPRWGR